MAEYSRGFARKLTEAARYLVETNEGCEDAARTVLYLSCLACEITLKAALEHADCEVKELRGRRCGHNVSGLLNKVSSGTVLVDGKRLPASRLRGVTVDPGLTHATVGKILSVITPEAQEEFSEYPNNIRYGSVVRHYHPALVLKAAELTLAWVNTHWDGFALTTAAGRT